MKKDRLEKIIADAEFAFWKAVAEACPEAKSGDLPPDVDLRHRQASEAAVEKWVLYNALKLPPEGARVRMTADVDRYPHFIVETGMSGVVEESDAVSGVTVRFDRYIEGCEEWKNRVFWQDDVLIVPDVMEVIEAAPASTPTPTKKTDYVVRVVRRTSEHVDVPVTATDQAEAQKLALAAADEYLDRNKDCDIEVDVAFVEPDPESERS